VASVFAIEVLARMLKLKRVQILGFKSFCDRTEVQLAGEGIAAIVGPNGCGKSNISDAITWVLGEQSAKSLRGLKMEDVIFAGTRDRKPTGMAEVSLTLVDPDVYDGSSPSHDGPELVPSTRQIQETSTDWDEAQLRKQAASETEEIIAEAQPGTVLDVNGDPLPNDTDEVAGAAADSVAADGLDTTAGADDVVLKIRRRKFKRTPVRAGEITVTRRLFRTGDSEYLLNGKICRLRDIQDIFMGTGLGGESYAIIGQERIGQLLSSKPLDRRGIIEEAAGITRFKTKKRLAELRLEAAKQNLSRVTDIFEEVTKQMTTLKRQADKAERYGALRDELRTKLRIALASRMVQLDTEQAATAGQIASQTIEIDRGSAEIEQLDAEHTAGMERGYNLDQHIRETNTQANQSAVELERIIARTSSNTDRIAELSDRIVSGSEDLAQVQAQLAQLSGEAEQHRSFLENATTKANQAREIAHLHQMSAQEAIRSVSAAEQQAEAGRRSALHLMQNSNQIRNEIAQTEAALAGLDRESERLQSESEVARQELSSLGLQRGQVKLSFEDVTERLRRLEAEIANLRLDTEARRKEESESKRRGDQLRGELASLNGRRTSLEGLIRDHSYSTDTVKNIFRSAKKNTQAEVSHLTPIGTLADFLEIEGQFGTVVDEFLREELNYVVVKSWDAADEGVRLLRSDVAGRATFLVHPQASESNEAIEEEAPKRRPSAEGLVPLRESIRVLNGFSGSLERLLPKLRDGYIAPDAGTARALALQHPSAWFLAPTGETFHNLTVTGGRPSSGGPLALKRELREILENVARVEADLSRTDIATATLSRVIAEVTAAIDARTIERREAERDAANSGAALRQMESETARIERRLQEWQISTERNRDQRNAKTDLIALRQQEAAAADAEHQAVEGALADVQSRLGDLRQQREHLQQASATASAALAGIEERRRNAQANFDQIHRLEQGQRQRMEQLEQQLSSSGTEKQRREGEQTTLAAQHTQLLDTRTNAVAQAAVLTAESNVLRTRLADLDHRLRALRSEIEALRDGRAQLMARAAKLASDIEHIDQTCLNDLGTEAATLREDNTMTHLRGEALLQQEEETRILKGKLEAMGPVNMMALEEYIETTQRHSFLETQRKDLLDSIENTQASIKEIDGVSRLKFDKAFQVINENFSVTFTRLFGGGQAFMKLTDQENAAESGIDIVASPPGKKLQNILLLSGGEKALTALSLLVGIFQFQPAPFCVLDEVDAPLDETNVGRFARLIHEMSTSTQFVVITHSKRTMAQADVIYGVTMQEPGVSKIVSVNLGGRRESTDSRRAVA